MLVARGIALDDYPSQARYLRDALRKVWQAVQRIAGRRPRYWRVYEWHRGLWSARWQVENHRLHVHALVEAPEIPGGGPRHDYRRRRDAWRGIALRCGLGIAKGIDLPAADQAEHLARVSNYVTKYCSKQKSDAHRYRVRVTAASRGLPPIPVDPEHVTPMALVRSPQLRTGHQSAVLAAAAGAHLVRHPRHGFAFDAANLQTLAPLDSIAHPLQHGKSAVRLSPGLILSLCHQPIAPWTDPLSKATTTPCPGPVAAR